MSDAATIGSSDARKKDDYRISKGAVHTILAVLGGHILIVVAAGIGMYTDIQVLKSTMARMETGFDKLIDKLVIDRNERRMEDRESRNDRP